MNTHPLNINSFDDMVDNLDESTLDQLGETLFALPNVNPVKAILAKYQVEIYQEGTCWILALLKGYGEEFDNEINPFLPCVSHNISFSDYQYKKPPRTNHQKHKRIMEAIIICPHTKLPVLAEIEVSEDKVLCLHRDTREEELDEIRHKFNFTPL